MSVTKAQVTGSALLDDCRSCHSLDPAAPTMAGPSLAGLIGRKLGGDPKFDYSPVLRQAATSGTAWTRERLDAFFSNPEGMFPGMWMTSRGIADAADRKALADFIADPASR